MTSGVADLAATSVDDDHRTTRATCPLCLIVLSLDDDLPKAGTVRWRLVPGFRLAIWKAVNFECPNGHSSEHDPDLLKAFPSRRF